MVGQAACAFEIFTTDDEEPIEYKDMVGGSAVLRKYDLVFENAPVFEENELLADEKDMIVKYDKPAGWKLLLMCLAALVTPVETTSVFDRDGQCLKADGPGDTAEFSEFYLFLLLILVSWLIIGYVAWRFGFRSGRHHVLQFRHVRSDRLGRLHAAATHKIVLLERRIDVLQDALQTSDVYVAELKSMKELGRDLVRRVLREVKEHLVVCPHGHTVVFAPISGRVWHAHRRCSRLNSANRLEDLPPCSYCANAEPMNLPDSYGWTLVEACDDWLRLTAD